MIRVPTLATVRVIMTARVLLAVTTTATLLLSIAAAARPARAATGFYIRGGRLYEANGNEFIMRGINHAHTWYRDRTRSFTDIKAAGANTIRVVLSSGHQWARNDVSDVTNVIGLCKRNRLICLLEVHDTTGYGEAGSAISLSQAADYWISIQSALTGQEQYVIVNIGNEPHGNRGYTAWTADTKDAIRKLRAAGFEHTIMVDAPNWGQDWQFVMRNNAAAVFAADPSANTIFSVHMYGVFDTAAEIGAYLNAFVGARLPIVVGEFGHDHPDGDPDEDAILATTQALRLGYLGWSWSGNGGGVEYLDMATRFNPANLTPWGQRIIDGDNGIRQTAREATVYGGTPPPPDPDPAPDPDPSCTATYVIQNQWAGGFQGAVRITAGSSSVSGWTVTWAFANGQSITSSWNAVVDSSGAAVTATNMSYNGSLAPGESTDFGFLGSWRGSNTAPRATCTPR